MAVPAPRQRTPEEIEASRIENERIQAEQKRLNEIEAEKRRLAKEKATALLKEVLKPEQKEEFERDKAITITGQSGQKYRIKLGRTMNVEVLIDGKVTANLCAHPSDSVPDEDTMLAQKLMLENDEAFFVGKANRREVRAAA